MTTGYDPAVQMAQVGNHFHWKRLNRKNRFPVKATSSLVFSNPGWRERRNFKTPPDAKTISHAASEWARKSNSNDPLRQTSGLELTFTERMWADRQSEINATRNWGRERGRERESGRLFVDIGGAEVRGEKPILLGTRERKQLSWGKRRKIGGRREQHLKARTVEYFLIESWCVTQVKWKNRQCRKRGDYKSETVGSCWQKQHPDLRQLTKVALSGKGQDVEHRHLIQSDGFSVQKENCFERSTSLKGKITRCLSLRYLVPFLEVQVWSVWSVSGVFYLIPFLPKICLKQSIFSHNPDETFSIPGTDRIILCPAMKEVIFCLLIFTLSNWRKYCFRGTGAFMTRPW